MIELRKAIFVTKRIIETMINETFPLG